MPQPLLTFHGNPIALDRVGDGNPRAAFVATPFDLGTFFSLQAHYGAAKNPYDAFPRDSYEAADQAKIGCWDKFEPPVRRCWRTCQSSEPRWRFPPPRHLMG